MELDIMSKQIKRLIIYVNKPLIIPLITVFLLVGLFFSFELYEMLSSGQYLYRGELYEANKHTESTYWTAVFKYGAFVFFFFYAACNVRDKKNETKEDEDSEEL